MLTLVLLPGMDGTGILFRRFTKALGADLQVRVVNYPTTGALDYAELEAVARAALPADGPYFLLGESFSGPIAIALAASRPPSLKGLMLTCSFARNPIPKFPQMHIFAGLAPISAPVIYILSLLLFGRFANREFRGELAHALTQVSPAAFRARLKSVVSVDVSAQLGEIAVPVLYLQTSADHVVPRRSAELILRSCPQMRIERLDAPHMLLQATPVRAAEIIGAFVREVTNQVHQSD